MNAFVLKRIWQTLALALGVDMLGSSCKKEEAGGLMLNTDVRIHAYTVGQTAATIVDTNRTITLGLPFGSSLTSVTPTITLAAGATVDPASGQTVDLSTPRTYTVVNGNLYSTYVVSARVLPAIESFVINGDTGIINETDRTITVSVPKATDVTRLSPAIQLATGISIAPASGAAQDFSAPVTYTVTAGSLQVPYQVYVVREGTQVAYLGSAATRDAITNLDEKAAADWLFARYPQARYLSFADIKVGAVNLSQFGLIWWHLDAAQQLPTLASDAMVINALKAYYAAGGSFLLTTFASQYVTTLGIVPAGKGPNNVFGDTTPFLSGGSDWGISWKNYESHPLFAGLQTTNAVPYAAAYLLDKNCWRLNHVGWWKVNDWGGYGNAANWRTQTGGLDLASEVPDENHLSNVAVAEFPKANGHGGTIVITVGGYDWYNENDPGTGAPSPANAYSSNRDRMTSNAIDYLNP